MRSEYLLRSMLYVPAYKENLIEKSLTTSADAIIYDLEDSVPQACKEKARMILENHILSGVFQKKLTFVRINCWESDWLLEDLKHVFYKDIDGFVLPKINTAEELKVFDEMLSKMELDNGIENGHFKLIPLIETAEAVLDALSIARVTKRTIALGFGGEDFLNDIQGTHGNPPCAFDYPRATIVMAARATGILPIDTPYLAIRDLEGFIKEKRQSYEMGFAGVQVVSPRQLEAAHQCFTPDEEVVKRSEGIMEAWKNAMAEGTAIAMYQDQMIGPPMKKRAEKILGIMEQIRQREIQRES